jgi:RHS repeat-associated protein
MPTAAKWFDPVLGIDIHLILTPAGVTVPVPHPFIGFVFDPAGLLVGMAISGAISAVFGGPFKGPVYINGMPAANTGTLVRGMPVHIPIGGTFVYPPSNEGTIITGSKTVHILGTSAARLTSQVNTCNDPINMPTSVVMAIPMGPPVNIGGPTAVDVMAAVLSAIRTQWVSEQLHSLLKLKPGSWGSKIVCFLTGHPVDVASGRVLTDQTDFALPGPLPFKFERNYSSASEYDGPLGRGWHHSFDQSVVVGKESILLRWEDGRVIEFDLVAEGGEVREPLEQLRLVRERDSLVIHTMDGRSLHFGPARRTDGVYPLARITDRNNNSLTLDYTGDRPTAITDSSGRVVRLAYNRSGRLVSLDAPDPEGGARRVRVAQFEYDNAGDLVCARDAIGNAFRYEYRNRMLIKEVDRNGLAFHFEYDEYAPHGWCVRTWGDGGIYDHKLTYHKQAKITIVENSVGARTTYFCTEFGLVRKVVDAAGASKLFEWDDHGRKVAETDALGGTTRFLFDDHGRLLATIDPRGHQTTTEYDALGNALSTTDEAGNRWRREFDERGNLVATLDPAGVEWRQTVNARGLLMALFDPLGLATRLEWDRSNNLTQVVDRLQAAVRFEYDGWGRTVRRIDAAGGVTSLSYDLLGRLVSSSDAAGRTHRLAYDPEGNLIEAVDPLGRRHRFAYGNRNKRTYAESPSGEIARYEYNTEGQLIAVRDATGREWTFERDSVGNVIEQRTFDGRRLCFEYDAAGRLIKSVNAKGETLVAQLDAAGRPLLCTYADGTHESFEYDPRGLMVRAENPFATVQWEYDALGRPLAECTNGKWLKNQYDALGRRVSRVSPLGRTLRLDYDAEGRLRRAFDGGKEVLSRTLDPRGLEVARRLPAEVVMERRYAATGELLASRTRRWDSTLTARDYHYDDGGQVVEIRDQTFGVTRFEHDVDGRLRAATFNDGTMERYDYDPAGNVLAAPERLLRDDSHRNIPEWRLRFDDDGQLIEERGPGRDFAYQYDAVGRLIKATSDTVTVEFSYDALGRRLQKRVGDEVVDYFWDDDQLIGDRTRQSEAGHGTSREYLLLPENFAPLVSFRDGDALFFDCDQVGAPRAAIRRDGQVVWEGEYAGFGLMRKELGERGLVRLRYPGHLADPETGLHYNRFRYYHPGLRMYLTPDPTGLAGGLEQYNYVPSPLTWVDLFGLQRGLWDLTREMSDAVRNIGGRMYYRHATTGLWWSRDTAGHGGSAFKVFTEGPGGKLNWFRDADEFGDFIDPAAKHKGPKGKTVC